MYNKGDTFILFKITSPRSVIVNNPNYPDKEYCIILSRGWNGWERNLKTTITAKNKGCIFHSHVLLFLFWYFVTMSCKLPEVLKTPKREQGKGETEKVRYNSVKGGQNEITAIKQFCTGTHFTHTIHCDLKQWLCESTYVCSARAGVCDVFFSEVYFNAVSVCLPWAQSSITLNPTAKQEGVTKRGKTSTETKDLKQGAKWNHLRSIWGTDSVVRLRVQKSTLSEFDVGRCGRIKKSVLCLTAY